MTRRVALLVLMAVVLVTFPGARPARLGDTREVLGKGPVPSDWFGAQRAFPGTAIPEGAWLAAVGRARVDDAVAEFSTSGDLLTWTEAGPTTSVAGSRRSPPIRRAARPTSARRTAACSSRPTSASTGRRSSTRSACPR